MRAIGTSTGRFLKAARSRARALRALGVDLTIETVRNSSEALRVIRRFIP